MIENIETKLITLNKDLINLKYKFFIEIDYLDKNIENINFFEDLVDFNYFKRVDKNLDLVKYKFILENKNLKNIFFNIPSYLYKLIKYEDYINDIITKYVNDIKLNTNVRYFLLSLIYHYFEFNLIINNIFNQNLKEKLIIFTYLKNKEKSNDTFLNEIKLNELIKYYDSEKNKIQTLNFNKKLNIKKFLNKKLIYEDNNIYIILKKYCSKLFNNDDIFNDKNKKIDFSKTNIIAILKLLFNEKFKKRKKFICFTNKNYFILNETEKNKAEFQEIEDITLNKKKTLSYNINDLTHLDNISWFNQEIFNILKNYFRILDLFDYLINNSLVVKKENTIITFIYIFIRYQKVIKKKFYKLSLNKDILIKEYYKLILLNLIKVSSSIKYIQEINDNDISGFQNLITNYIEKFKNWDKLDYSMIHDLISFYNQIYNSNIYNEINEYDKGLLENFKLNLNKMELILKKDFEEYKLVILYKKYLNINIINCLNDTIETWFNDIINDYVKLNQIVDIFDYLINSNFVYEKEKLFFFEKINYLFSNLFSKMILNFIKKNYKIEEVIYFNVLINEAIIKINNNQYNIKLNFKKFLIVKFKDYLKNALADYLFINIQIGDFIIINNKLKEFKQLEIRYIEIFNLFDIEYNNIKNDINEDFLISSKYLENKQKIFKNYWSLVFKNKILNLDKSDEVLINITKIMYSYLKYLFKIFSIKIYENVIQSFINFFVNELGNEVKILNDNTNKYLRTSKIKNKINPVTPIITSILKCNIICRLIEIITINYNFLNQKYEINEKILNNEIEKYDINYKILKKILKTCVNDKLYYKYLNIIKNLKK